MFGKGDKVLVIGEIRYREYDDEVTKGKTKIEVRKRMAEIHAAGVERLYKAEKTTIASDDGGRLKPALSFSKVPAN